jgi:hypothetical protein
MKIKTDININLNIKNGILSKIINFLDKYNLAILVLILTFISGYYFYFYLNN